MKISTLIPLLLFIFLSCNEAPDSSTTSTETPATNDIPAVAEKTPQEKTDNYTEAIKMVKNKVEKESNFSKDGVQYDIQTIHLDNLLVKLMATYARDDYQYEETFYVRNDALVMYHANQRKDNPQDSLTTLSETKVYLDNYKIVEVLEKSKKSKPGGNLSLMDEYFTPIKVNQDSLQAELNKQLTFLKENLK